MAKRSENMLEAFKSSTAPAQERTGKPAKPSRGAGGPFAPPAAPRSSGLPEGLSLSANPAGLAMMAGVVLLLAMAFLLGRLSAPSVEAAAPGESSGAGFQFPVLTESPGTDEVARATPPEVAEGATAADRAFLEPANRYTIRAVEYGRNEREQALAFAAYDQLRENGFPVVWPRHKGEFLYLFVGAAASMQDLKDVLERLWATPGPGRDKDAYEKAFVVNIEDYL
jgi:hypothetical protein